MELTPIYFLISVFIFLFLSGAASFSDHPFSLRSIFIFQCWVYEHTKDDFNILGIIIMETVITVLTFGASVLMASMLAIMFAILQLWRLFCFIFKKR